MVKKEIKKISPRNRDTHKGDYGHVFILSGSRGMTGAAYLSSQAALLSGSGLVTLGIPKGLNSVMEVKLTEVMTLPLDETAEQSFDIGGEKAILDFAAKTDAVAIGPGISGNPSTRKLVKKLVKKIKKPMVLDADGINAFERDAKKLKDRRAPLVITPHPGEMARIASQDARTVRKDMKAVAKKISKLYDCVTVLKGARTVVTDPKGEIYINSTGNPGMATGGSGDVLTGIIVSFIGQGIDPFGASKLAVYLHGRAGDLARSEKGEISLIASDILGKLPAALKNI